MSKREFNVEIMEEIKERWSPRAISREKISDEDLNAILEAARYAPSCFNEQPWRFLVAKEDESHSKMVGVLTASNQVWAKNAPVLILVLAKRLFDQNGKENYWHMFDAGTAWGYLSLEAQRRGLVTHAMGGFSKEKAREAFGISEEYDLMAVVAVGKYGNINDLPDDLKEREEQGVRLDLDKIIIK